MTNIARGRSLATSADSGPVGDAFPYADPPDPPTAATPATWTQRLATPPHTDPPAGTYLDDGPAMLGDVETGDWIALDGRWHRIVGCWRINDTVGIQLHDGPTVEAAWNTPAALAHPCCIPGAAKRC